MKDLTESIRRRLEQTLPGEEAQYMMAPVQRPRLQELKSQSNLYRESAVLILLTPSREGLYIPLTERFSYSGSHSAQVSLPGGKLDAADPDLSYTAIRECKEEIGVDPRSVTLLGSLSELYIPVSKFKVTPFVGYSEEELSFSKDPREVKTILELRIQELKDGHNIREGNIELENGIIKKAPYFEIEGRKVWGATAMILSEFRSILNTIA